MKLSKFFWFSRSTYRKMTSSVLLVSRAWSAHLSTLKKYLLRLENSQESSGRNAKSMSYAVLKWWTNKLEKYFLRYGLKRNLDLNQTNSSNELCTAKLVWKLKFRQIGRYLFFVLFSAAKIFWLRTFETISFN